MKKKVKIFKVWLFISVIIVGVIFFFGIIKNPSFSVLDFFTNLSSEMVGFFIVAIIFKFYVDEKIIVHEIEQRLERESNDDLSVSDLRKKITEMSKTIVQEKMKKDEFSVADELIKLKDLLNGGVITMEEFENIKSSYITQFMSMQDKQVKE